MLIRIDDIKDEGISRDFREPPESFPVLDEMSKRGEGEISLPLSVHVRVFRVSEMFEAEGRIETAYRTSCSRCLAEVEVALSIPFAVTYVRQLPEVETDADDEGFEISADEMGLILAEGDEIDLTDPVQEHVIMALPLRPLCREECKGLCPRCGADLNRGDCGCERTDFNLKFAALKDFKVEKKDQEKE